MSISKCALTGKLLQDPVISLNTGHVFEKEDIEKHIDNTGQCPITGNSLRKDDLISIKKSDMINSNNEHNSFPINLGRLQTEWDSVLLENFKIKKQLEDIKHELSKTLYQHEAASLVICRLIKERDEALKELNSYKAQIEDIKQNEEVDTGEEFDYMGIYDDLVERMNKVFTKLSSDRKKRELKEVKNFSDIKIKSSFPIHSASKPGITCLAIHPVLDNLIITGGIDGKGVLFNESNDKIITSVENHGKRINDVEFYPSDDIIAFLICSGDSTASFWVEGDKFIEKYRITNHANQVTSCSFHPLKEYALLSSKDSFWSFHNLFKGICLTKQKSEAEINTCEIHPDGLIFGTGESDGILRIWDLSTQKNVFNFDAHEKGINSITFSENGFYLASSGVRDNIVKIWDLRGPKLFKNIELSENKEVRKVKFDKSGQILGIAGTNISILNLKSMNITEFNDHNDIVTDIAFSKDLRYFASTSMDRNLNIYN